MKKILNKRLEMVSAFIDDDEKIIDIGCDHGFLGIYLVLNRKNVRVISSDINEKPLLIAKENVLKYHLENSIELKLGNGLEPITNDVTTVVVSGMGGISIANIINNVQKYPNVKKLVLSPNTDFEYLRKKIHTVGYTITEERIVYEKRKYYLIIEAIKGKKKVHPFFGKLDLNDKVVREYYSDIYVKNQRLLKNISIKNKIKRWIIIYESLLIRRYLNIKK